MVQNTNLKSICFNLPDSYSLFFEGTGKSFGGAEVRGVTIARELAKRGYNVSVVIREYEKRIDERVENVRVISNSYFTNFKRSLNSKFVDQIYYLFNNSRSLKKDDFFKWLPYIKVNAHYYAAFEITSATKNLVDYCSSFNKKFLLFIASDGELSFNDEPSRQLNVQQELASYIIGSADKIYVQNSFQLQKLKQYFKIDGVKVNNPLPLGIESKGLIESESLRKHIVWIGKSSKAKQPSFFIDLAKQFPEQIFTMVMNRNEVDIHEKVIADLPSNVSLIESMSFNEVNTLMKSTKLFINTSLYEGFPNTFLQAAYFGVPIISLNVNPNDFVDRSGGGVCCNGSTVKMKESLAGILRSDEVYKKMSENIRDYVIKEHGVTSVINSIVQSL